MSVSVSVSVYVTSRCEDTCRARVNDPSSIILTFKADQVIPVGSQLRIDFSPGGTMFGSLESVPASHGDVRNSVKKYTDPGATLLVPSSGSNNGTDINTLLQIDVTLCCPSLYTDEYYKFQSTVPSTRLVHIPAATKISNSSHAS